MAYGNKYLFRFEADNGTTYRIYIAQDGYSGSVIQRPMGKAPVLRQDQGDHIWGTSLTFYPESQTDGEFSFLYTSNPKAYKVTLTDDDEYVIWQGFVSPELYSEPDIAPPYDVEVVATDGLGELKTKDWAPASTKATIRSHITSLLSETGLSLSLGTISSLRTTGTTAANFLQTVNVDLGHLSGKTYYEVLESLLTSLNAVITQSGGAWKFVRPTDYAGSNAGSYSYGSMGTHSIWPVGQLETEIVPAKNKIIVQAPNFNKKSILVNPDMLSDTGWSTYGRAGYSGVAPSRTRAYYWVLPAIIIDGVTYPAGELFQSVSLTTLKDMCLTTTVTAGLYMQITYTAGGVVYYLSHSGDGNTLTDYSWVTSPTFIDLYDGGDQVDLDCYLPARTDAGTLTVSYRSNGSPRTGNSTKIYASYLRLTDEYSGLQLNLNLNNGARNESDPVELSFSNYGDSAANTDIEKYQSGIPTISNTPALNWQTNLLEAQGYIGFAAMDLALLNALPRIRKRGKLNIPASIAHIVPMAFSDGNLTYIVEKYEYDIYKSELNVEMISLPATSLSIASQVYSTLVTESSGTSHSSSGGGGGGSAGGTVTSVGLTAPAGFSVSGSPVTSSGTIGLQLNADRVIPTTTQVNVWNSKPSSASVAQMISNQAAAKITQMPKLTIWRGHQGETGDREFIQVSHGLIDASGTLGGEAVLMIYRRGNHRQTEYHQWYKKKGWAVAKGRYWDSAHHAALTPTSVPKDCLDLSDLRNYLIRNFAWWDGKSQAELEAMTYSEWERAEVVDYKRGFLIKGKVKPTLRLGIAVRMMNPDFIYTGELVEDTQEILGKPRYLYSPVAEITAFLGSDQGRHNMSYLHFGLP